MDNCRDVQIFLDRWVLQYMDEMTPAYYDAFGFNLNCFVAEPWLTKDMARAACRSLRDRGYAIFMKGLFTEDGEMAGAGYGITTKGREYLKTICATDEVFYP